MSGDDKLKQRLADFMSKLSVEPTKKDLDNAVKSVFTDKKKAAKDAGDKPKRKLSSWNLFYKEQSIILKKSEEDKDKEDRMSAKEKMSYIASLWKNKQSSDDTTEAFEEAVEEHEPEPEHESDSEPEIKHEVKPEPKKKFGGGGSDGKKEFKNGPKKFGKGNGGDK